MIQPRSVEEIIISLEKGLDRIVELNKRKEDTKVERNQMALNLEALARRIRKGCLIP